MDIITIPSTTIKNSTTYYHIAIKLPLRSLSTEKRFLEFEELHASLSKELGINPSDFPYSLPGKRLKWLSNSASTVELRRNDLSIYLNNVVRDKEIQNSPILLRFLNLPVNFKFNVGLFKPEVTDLQADPDSINEDNWLEIVRKFKAELSLLSEPKETFEDRLERRTKISKSLQPCLSNLSTTLHRLNIDSKEKIRREGILRDLKSELDRLIRTSLTKESEAKPFTAVEGKRVFGKPRETKETMLLDNKELLQQQVQIQKDQDQELEQLLRIVQRQKQIGEAINTEVEEQNEMLDQFEEEVHDASEKLRGARRNAKKIL